VDRSDVENPDHATMATVPNADLAVKVVAAPAVIAESTVSIFINEETLPVKQAAFFFCHQRSFSRVRIERTGVLQDPAAGFSNTSSLPLFQALFFCNDTAIHNTSVFRTLRYRC
jgi:hypothetical protein